jgi:dTMP kinase
MRTPSLPNLFFTFEGIDGSGKSTQIQLLADYLKRLRIPHLVTREPGGTRLGERIRQVLLPRASAGMDPHTEVLLYFAARAQNVAENILPALAAGRMVLCDRFTDASLAYQGYGRGLDLAFIRQLHRVACQNLRPHLTFVLDIDPHTSVRRARRRNTTARYDEGRFEQEALAFHQRVRCGYRALARQEPRRVKLIPGEDSIQTIHDKIVALAQPLLRTWTRKRRR